MDNVVVLTVECADPAICAKLAEYGSATAEARSASAEDKHRRLAERGLKYV